MKIILNESYANLGEIGDVVNVRPGYARNFLIPQKIAVTATAHNQQIFKDKEKEILKKRENSRGKAEKILELLKEIKIEKNVATSRDGKLYGSITNRDIQEELKSQGALVDRKQIVLNKAIKMVGEYTASVRLIGSMNATIPISITSSSVNLNQIEEDDIEDLSETEKNQADENLTDELAKDGD